jgi:hypothetical protein
MGWGLIDWFHVLYEQNVRIHKGKCKNLEIISMFYNLLCIVNSVKIIKLKHEKEARILNNMYIMSAWS